ncbi:MAG: hypothetical protein ACI9WU_001743, partial [Myxococcota bacterium]
MVRVFFLATFLLLLSGCSNACEELADKVCSRAGEDLSECAGVASKDDKAGDACARMKGVVASCRSLMDKAPEADTEDLAACQADLGLIRA